MLKWDRTNEPKRNTKRLTTKVTRATFKYEKNG